MPRCSSCHRSERFLSATASAAHSAVECKACHRSSGRLSAVSYGASHLKYLVPGIKVTGRDGTAVPDSRCLACHKDIAAKPVSSNGVNIAHETCAKGSFCTDCHSTTGHGSASAWPRVYDMETCLGCHVSKASTKCDLCHQGRLPASRVTSGVFAVTHGAEWQKTHGMGNSATCSICHTAASCEKCHGPGLPHDPKFIQKHSTFAQRPDAKCSMCHDKTFCSDCHGLSMPHPAQFTRQHAKSAEANRAQCNR